MPVATARLKTFAIAASLPLGLLCGPSYSETANPKPLPFGRYDLVKGQDNPVCLAVGEQVKAYQKVPHQLRPHETVAWGLDPHVIATADFRCDYPLESKGGITVPVWKPFDPTVAPFRNSVRADEVFSGFFIDGKPWDLIRLPSGPELSARERFIRGSRPIDQLTAWGVMRFQSATIAMRDFGPLTIYRFSDPPNLLQNCWTIGVERDSPLYRLRFIRFRIAQVFQFGTDTYFVSGQTPVARSSPDRIDIRIASLDRLAALDLSMDTPDAVTRQVPPTPDAKDPRIAPNTCEFKTHVNSICGPGKSAPLPPGGSVRISTRERRHEEHTCSVAG